MRDINRIDVLLNKFSELWHKYPDMRFWQMVMFLAGETYKDVKVQDLFFLEDDKAINTINRMLEEVTNT